MRGMNPAYLAKLDEPQRAFVLSGHGKFFLDNFVFVKGEHCYIVGPTGSGKTNKGMGLVDYVKHTETVIWISSGKDDEILPLLYMGKPVNIIAPKYNDVEIMMGREKYNPQPNLIHIPTPSDAWWAVRKGEINIFEFRNAFWDKSALIAWMIELFTVLATWTRLNMMPHIAPASIFMDESKWMVAGTRITNDSKRVTAADIITENAMDIRAYGFRLVVFAQSFTDVPPAMRENLPCFVLCSGAQVDENKKLRCHCNPTVPGWKRTTQYRRNQAKFVDRLGNSSPSDKPWDWPLFPKQESDRELCRKMRVKYSGYHDRPPKEAEAEEECIPELGRFSALAIPPEKQDNHEYSRWQGMINNE